ncbi:MAG: 1-acyl-sn-glycerol-3-phosphate acyltransferase [Sphingomonas sp.]|uniref:lysophospholipid acyltransferase family protein n=1 Tax=Sphingomonas sp. TaxID=28214 RepID=UPI0025FCC518|nr:lysophospholipid acyltransferase family protein [Sphingomonas sp.]MBX3565969.1 1-acyl-sn-glycerol-3-phosphate acyltransferase [Sphingomonas sp.]
MSRREAAARGAPYPLTTIETLRVSWRVFLLVLLILTHVPMHYLWKLLHLPSAWPRWFLARVGWIAGARVRKIGVPLRKNVFYVANHLSWIDILALGGASGTAFIAKAELAQAPLVGWLAGLNRTVYVKRENRLGVAEQINELRDALDENWAVTIFPEGTTTDGQSLLPFKTPMLRVLEPPPPGVMVQPVLLDYGAVAEDIGWIGEESGIVNAKRILARKGRFRLDIHFLEPFHPRDFPGRKAIAAESRRVIEGALIATLGKPLRDFAHTVEAVRYEGKPADL